LIGSVSLSIVMLIVEPVGDVNGTRSQATTAATVTKAMK
jgi:hypothetical protein